MKFLVITHVLHTKSDNTYYGYGPYVKEMNLWYENVDKVRVIAPLSIHKPDAIDLAYNHSNLDFVKVPFLDFTSWANRIKSFLALPIIIFQLIKGMLWADHIHLRCPGNMGLLGTVVQILFPKKTKTAKYAGNWDPKSPQPLTYRWQRSLLSNTSLTKNMQTLIYGDWDNLNQNHLSFFTATYWEKDKEEITPLALDKAQKINFLFVGSLSEGKQPLLSVKVIHELKKQGLQPILNICGEGVERTKLETYIKENDLTNEVILHGNVNASQVKQFFKGSHFLLFISKSEGWPKVVAESMFWSCLPITTRVSCVAWMLNEGERGELVKPEIQEIVTRIKKLVDSPQTYQEKVNFAKEWSQEYTLDKFESEIKKLI